ncbi:hypothetical protein [Nonomuraea sp. NPDC049158]|uniref:hypothetical protein n=1 Tax=Nonomuraea sp. NPDC049158 TaxID=3155649 RepID=UPI0033F8325D
MLRHFDHAVQADIEARYGLPLRKTAFEPDLIGPATLGHITEAQWVESIAAALGGDERSREAAAEFAAVPFWVDEEVRGLLARAQERVPVVLVTNAMDTLEEQGMTGMHYRSIADLALRSAGCSTSAVRRV